MRLLLEPLLVLLWFWQDRQALYCRPAPDDRVPGPPSEEFQRRAGLVRSLCRGYYEGRQAATARRRRYITAWQEWAKIKPRRARGKWLWPWIDRLPRSRLKLAVIGLLIPAIMGGAGTNYYVSPTGSDGNAGTSTGAPFQHFSAAVTVAVASDLINIMAGTHEGVWDTNYSGSQHPRDGVIVQNHAGATPIVRRSHGGSNAGPVLDIKGWTNCTFRQNPADIGTSATVIVRHDGTPVNQGDGYLYVGNATTSGLWMRTATGATTSSGNLISGWQFEDIFGNGINLTNTTASTIELCTIDGGASGIRIVDGSGVTIEDNHIFDVGYMHNNSTTASTNNGAMGIALDGPLSFTVRRNLVHGCWSRTGSHNYGTDGGFCEFYDIPNGSGSVVGGAGSGWTLSSYTGAGNGNVVFDNHNFIETGRNAVGNENGGIEVSYNLGFGRNDFQAEGTGHDGGSFAATTSFFLIRALQDGWIHHNTWDFDDGMVDNSGIRFQQGGSFNGVITGITIEDNILRMRFSTPAYNFVSIAIPASTTVRNNCVFYVSNYAGNVITRSGTDYTLTGLAAAQSATGTFAAELWGDADSNEAAANPDLTDCTNASLAARDYALLSSSPAIAAAHDGSDIGAFDYVPPSPDVYSTREHHLLMDSG